jgi:hypothetical protein
MEIINWLQNWYEKECDGDWEHGYGVEIKTIDNPGWKVKINISKYFDDNYSLNIIQDETSAKDWYSYKIENSFFYGYSDPNKLFFLLEKFKEIIETASPARTRM